MTNNIYKNTFEGQRAELRKAWCKFIDAVIVETKNNKVKKFLEDLKRHDHDTD